MQKGRVINLPYLREVTKNANTDNTLNHITLPLEPLLEDEIGNTETKFSTIRLFR